MTQPVLIIGAGLAGLTAALTLAENGRDSVLISTMPSQRAQSVMAEGGINAALDTRGEHDCPAEHFADTMAAGCYLADAKAVRRLTEQAPEVVCTLARMGVPFQRTETGQIDLRYFGGQAKRRTAFVKSSTGKQLMTAMIAAVRRWERAGRITRMAHHSFQKLLINGESEITGCIIMDNNTKCCQILQGSVILASGGLNGLFGKTTGSTLNTGAVSAAVYDAGIPCANLEMIQYHPTTTAYSGKRLLISEAARGEGGRLFVLRGSERWYYMEELYPTLGNRMPRDVVARETERVCRENGAENAWLDLTALSPDSQERLSDLFDFARQYLKTDPARSPLPVYPGIHYFMGGIDVDADHRTAAKYLYAAGECACQYHGANRLGGNSLLGAIVGGKTAAQSALHDGAPQEAPKEEELDRFLAELAAPAQNGKEVSCRAVEMELAESMNRALGLRRSGETIEAALSALSALEKKVEEGFDPAAEPGQQRLLLCRLHLACAMAASALARKESRGAHLREDYSAAENAFEGKQTVVVQRNGRAEIWFRTAEKEDEG